MAKKGRKEAKKVSMKQSSGPGAKEGRNALSTLTDLRTDWLDRILMRKIGKALSLSRRVEVEDVPQNAQRSPKNFHFLYLATFPKYTKATPGAVRSTH